MNGPLKSDDSSDHTQHQDISDHSCCLVKEIRLTQLAQVFPRESYELFVHAFL